MAAEEIRVAATVGGETLAEIWRTDDDRERVVAFMSKGRDHILQRRPKMAGRMGEIRTAIERPTLVTRDALHARRECHYLRTAAEPGWMKGVVTYRPTPPQGTWAGEIITTYPIRRPEPEKMPLWP